MSKHIEHENLIMRFLSGEADSKEKELLLDWLKASPNNVGEFNSIRAVADVLAKESRPKFNVEKAIAGFDEYLTVENKTVELKSNIAKKLWWSISSVAAVAILLIGLFFGNFREQKMQVLAQAGDESKEVTLKDGTVAVLSPNSQLLATEDFGTKNRKLKLKGEVFVKVKHDEAHPFSIEVNEVNIQDIGTAFKVTADSVSGDVLINVHEGVVQIDYAKKTQVLNAGEFALIKTSTKKVERGHVDISMPIKEQIEKELVFEDTNLDDVINQINKKYNANFVLMSTDLSTLRLNASFGDSMSVREIEDLLQVVLNVDIKEEKGELKIYKLDN